MTWFSDERLIRPYQEGRGFPAVERMCQEVGWMDDAAIAPLRVVWGWDF